MDSPVALTAYEEAILTGQELLGSRLKYLRIGSVRVHGDGNCQFRALSQQLYGCADFHGSVRRAVVAHMLEERSFFSAMFDGDADFEGYLRRMRELKCWGDELTLRAAADCFSCAVHVVTSTETNWYLLYSPAEKPKKHLFLVYVSPVHYDALTLAEETQI